MKFPFRPPILTLLLIFAFLHAALYGLSTPPWGLLDEEQHIDYIIKAAQTGRPPIVGQDYLDARITGSVMETQRHARFRWPAPAGASVEQWGLEGHSYEGYQGPAYYYLLVPFYLSFGGSILDALFALRLLSILLSLVTVWAAVKITRLVLPDQPNLSYWAGALIAALPQRAAAVANVSNDILLEMISILTIWAVTHAILKGVTWKSAALLGLLAGLGLLTKISYAGLLLVLPIPFLLHLRAEKVALKAALSLLIFGLAAGPYLLYNQALYGDFTGFRAFETLYTTIIAPIWNPAFSLASVVDVSWKMFYGFWVVWWNSALAGYPLGVTLLVAALFGLALLAAGLYLKELSEWFRSGDWRRSAVFITYLGVILIYLILTGVGYYQGKFPVMQGRFLSPALFPIIFVICAGLNQIRWKLPIFIGLCSALLIVDAIYLFGHLLPYFYYGSVFFENGVPTGRQWLGRRWAVQTFLAGFVSDKPAWVVVLFLIALTGYVLLIGYALTRFLQTPGRDWPRPGVSASLAAWLSANRRLLTIAVIAFLVFFGLAAAKPGGVFWSLDEGGKWIYLENVLRTHDPRAPLLYPGRALDTNLKNIALHFFIRAGSDIYAWWPVGFPLLTLPFYQLLGWPGLYLLPALGGAVTVFFSGKIARLLTPDRPAAADLTAVAVALATPVAFYSMTFWEHTLAAAFVLVAACCLCASLRSEQVRWPVWGGLAASLAIFFRTESALVVIGFGLALLLTRWKKAVWYALAAGVASLPWLAGNQWLMGSPVSRNFQTVQDAGNAVSSLGLKYIPYALFNFPTIGAYSLGAALLITGLIGAALAVVFGLFPKTRLLSLLGLLVVAGVCMAVLAQPGLYRSVHGFLLISPLAAAGSWFFSSRLWKQNRAAGWLLLSGVAVFAVGYIIKSWAAAGGLQWGPRYMLAMYPLFMIFAVPAALEAFDGWKDLRRYLLLAVFSLAFLVGVGFQARGYTTMLRTLDLYRQSGQALRGLSAEVIKTDCTWMQMVIPGLYWDGNIFRNTPDPTFEQNLARAGKDSYLFVKMISCNTRYIDEVIQEYETNPGGLLIQREALTHR